jgi:hypothetical protein
MVALGFSSSTHGTLWVPYVRYDCLGMGEPLARNRTESFCQV